MDFDCARSPLGSEKRDAIDFDCCWRSPLGSEKRDTVDFDCALSPLGSEKRDIIDFDCGRGSPLGSEKRDTIDFDRAPRSPLGSEKRENIDFEGDAPSWHCSLSEIPITNETAFVTEMSGNSSLSPRLLSLEHQEIEDCSEENDRFIDSLFTIFYFDEENGLSVG
jgi:hypothetical protein